jgi:UDP-N-acetylglucosamine 1-carboxyvinyltransferase
MQQFVIEGGHPLSGEVVPGGNKNAALKMLPACLLTDEPVILRNVPDIGDVRVMIELMQQLGVEIEWQGNKTLRVHAREITSTTLDPLLAQKMRASVVLAGPMLARRGRLELPIPGGDAIGERRLDLHFIALQKLGAQINFSGAFQLHTDGLVGTDILLREASVTATENGLLAAVLAKGTTIIRNAASEPHVQNLCQMLTGMGAEIEGIGTNRLIITGKDRLHGGEAQVGADYLEVVSFVGAAAVTGGEILVREANPEHLDMISLTLERLGVEWQVRGQDIFVSGRQSLTIVPDLGSRIPEIKAQPWPAFPADLMSIALVVSTQSAGAVLFHDWMYESRFFFTDKLSRMGARITLCDPHRVLVQGPTKLKGAPYIASPDIRAGMALVLAALAADGETRISNIQQIDRGYERVEEKLSALGAQIRRLQVESRDVTYEPEIQTPR